MVGDSRRVRGLTYSDIYEWLTYGYEIGYLKMDSETEDRYYQWVDKLEEIRKR